MEAFFIIVVGGLWWLYHWFTESSTHTANERFDARAERIRNEIAAPLDMKNYFSFGLLENKDSKRWEMLTSISDELEEVFGDYWMSYYLREPENECLPYDVWKPYAIAFHILLSKNGKVNNYFGLGIKIPRDEEDMRHELRMLRIVERNMQLRYPDLPMEMYFKQEPDYTYLSEKKYKEPLYEGKMYWKFNINMSVYKHNGKPLYRKLW